MPIGTSDGQYYEDDFESTAARIGADTSQRAPTRITVSKQPELDVVEHPEVYDDGPTLMQRTRDSLDTTKPSYNDLKREEDIQSGDYTDPEDTLVQPQKIADYRQGYVGPHRLPTITPEAITGPSDHFRAGGASITQQGLNAFRNSLQQSERIAQPPTPAPRGTLERQGQNTFNREVRRSPSDNTFRTRDEMLNNWERFISPGPRAERNIHDRMASDQYEAYLSRGGYNTEGGVPRGWSHVEGGAFAFGTRDISGKDSHYGVVPFKTLSGKEGEANYLYNADTKNIYVSWMGRSKKPGSPGIEPHEFGADKVKEVLTEIVKKHPDAETISAYRVSGARSGNAKNITRPIPKYTQDDDHIQRQESGVTDRIGSFIGNLFGMKEKASGAQSVDEAGFHMYGPVQTTLHIASKLDHYPTSEEVEFAKQAGFYENTYAPWTKGKIAKVIGQTVARYGSTDTVTQPEMADFVKGNPQLAEIYAKGALVSNRIPIAAVGFEPARTNVDPYTKPAQTNLLGAYKAKTDTMYVVGDAASVIVHESIHRGIEQLTRKYPDEVKPLLKDLPQEEFIVRYLMVTQAGNPEPAAEAVGKENPQIKTAMLLFGEPGKEPPTSLSLKWQNNLEKLTSIAQKYIKENKPGGHGR